MSKTSFYVLQLKYYGYWKNAWYFFPWAILFGILGILMNVWIVPTYMIPNLGSGGMPESTQMVVKIVTNAAPHVFALIFTLVGLGQLRGIKARREAIEKGKLVFGPANVEMYSTTITQNGWSMYHANILRFTYSDNKTFNVSVKECLSNKLVKKIQKYKGDLPLKVYQRDDKVDVVLDEKTLDEVLSGNFDFSQIYEDLFLPMVEHCKKEKEKFDANVARIQEASIEKEKFSAEDEEFIKKHVLYARQGDQKSLVGGDAKIKVETMLKDPKYANNTRLHFLKGAMEYAFYSFGYEGETTLRRAVKELWVAAKNYYAPAFNLIGHIYQRCTPCKSDADRQYYTVCYAINKMLERGSSNTFDIYVKDFSNLKSPSIEKVVNGARVYYCLKYKDGQRDRFLEFANSSKCEQARLFKSYYSIRDTINKRISAGIYNAKHFERLHMIDTLQYGIYYAFNDAYEGMDNFIKLNLSKICSFEPPYNY